MYNKLRIVMHESMGFGPYYVFCVIGAAICLFASGAMPTNWITISAVPLTIALTAVLYRSWRRLVAPRTPGEFVAAVRKAAKVTD